MAQISRRGRCEALSRIASVTYFFRGADRVFERHPFPRQAAIAADRVHPEPCTSPTSRYSLRNSVKIPFRQQTSKRCAHLSVSAFHEHCARAHRTELLPPRVACRLQFRIENPASFSASGMFGVTTRASGNNLVFRISKASSSIRTSPEVATTTGSTTGAGRFSSAKSRATSATISAVGNIPVFAAATVKS